MTLQVTSRRWSGLRQGRGRLRQQQVHLVARGRGRAAQIRTIDGWRLAIFRGRRGVMLQSRNGRDLTCYFPDIADAAATLEPGTVLDGEAVIWLGEQSDFAALQRRISAGVDPAAPANYVAFDLLQHPTRGVVMSLPLSTRRELLIEVLADVPPTIGVCPQTDDVAVADNWMAEWTPAVEGVMIKAASGRYLPGVRGRGWLKRKATHTVDLLIGGVTGTLRRPRTLLLGRRIGRRVSYVGHTTLLSDRASAEVADLLTNVGASETEPTWPSPLPARWVGFHQDQPLEYVAVTPIATVEVLADRAFEHGRCRHALRFVRNRAELH